MYTMRIVNGLRQLRQSKFMKDSMIVGLFSGLLGAVAIELVNTLLGKKLFFGKAASSMVVNSVRSNRLKNIMFGEIMHLTVGAGIGSIITIIIEKTGKDFVMIKGTFISLLAWIGLHNIGRRMDLFNIKPRSTRNHYFSLIQHLGYGICTSALIKYLTNPVTFRQASITKSKTQIPYDQFFWPPEPEPTMIENVLH